MKGGPEAARGLVVFTPYPEASIGRLASSARRADPSSPGAFTVRSWSPSRLVDSLGAASSVSRRFGLRRTSSSAMYAHKAVFDRSVASRIKRIDPSVVVGMWAASLYTFKATNAVRVLNFVNAHPTRHNQVLSAIGVPPHHPELVPPWVEQRVNAELELADLVVVPSDQVRQDMLARGLPAERLVTAPYGVDLDKFRPVARASASESTSLNVLFVGQISHRKGIRALMDAATENRGVAFTLIGPVVSPEVLLGKPSNINVRPTMKPDDLRMAMAQADLFVLPSYEDTFGLVVLEALASGTPVAVSQGAGASELITPDAGWTFTAGSAQSLSRILSLAAADRERLAAMRGPARSLAERYPWARFTDHVHAQIASRLGDTGLGFDMVAE